jgi:hypothetical protein
MNLQIIATQELQQSHVNMRLYECLCHEIGEQGIVTVVDKNPDIVHLLGAWNKESIKVIQGFNAKNIPVVFTSVDGLIGLNASEYKLSNQSSISHCVINISQRVAAVHVCGSVEDHIVHELSKGVNTFCIKNCYYTNVISKQDMLRKFEEMYVSIAEKHEESIRRLISTQIKDANISDQAIARITSKILYLQNLHIKGSIPIAYVNELSKTFIETDYDERQLCTVLHKLKLYKFTSRAMQMLSECSTLTEGFMPMPPTDDKVTTTLKQSVIQ